MSYGKDKVRGMARSILPSAHRRQAREHKNRISRTTRRSERQAIGTMDYDEGLDFDDRQRNIDLGWMKSERREADKVKPLMRWAPKVTKGQPDKRMAQLRAMLPNNTIGDHAISHVRYLKEFRNNNEALYNYRPWRTPEAPIPDYKSMLYDVCIHLHGLYNQYSKHAVYTTNPFYTREHKPNRLLTGLHDIDSYWHDVVTSRDPKSPYDTYATKYRMLMFLDKLIELNYDIYEFRSQFSSFDAQLFGIMDSPSNLYRLK